MECLPIRGVKKISRAALPHNLLISSNSSFLIHGPVQLALAYAQNASLPGAATKRFNPCSEQVQLSPQPAHCCLVVGLCSMDAYEQLGLSALHASEVHDEGVKVDLHQVVRFMNVQQRLWSKMSIGTAAAVLACSS